MRSGQNRRPIPKRKDRLCQLEHLSTSVSTLSIQNTTVAGTDNSPRASSTLPRFLEDTNAYTGKSGASNRILRGVPLRALAKDKETRDMRETKHGHKGPYLPLIFEACGEDQYASEYRDGVTAYGAFTYFVTKTLFDLGHEHAGTRRKRKFTFQDLVINVAEVMKPYYNQQPQLVGPKAWRRAEVPWKTPRRARPPRRRKR